MESKKQGRIAVFLAVAMLATVLAAGRENAQRISADKVVTKDKKSGERDPEFCVVIDVGHGGIDPGKVGINGALEKDVNLQIAERVKNFLEQEDVRVIMTREADEGLYDSDASNKKVQDMKRRVALIEESKADLTVSIHQNSYPKESVHGSQVFYYKGSAESLKLAEKIQESMTDRVDPDNRRQVKANDSYYLLKKTSLPIVIVECGFLSNRQEADALCEEDYQRRIAWAIHLGILQYLND